MILASQSYILKNVVENAVRKKTVLGKTPERLVKKHLQSAKISLQEVLPFVEPQNSHCQRTCV